MDRSTAGHCRLRMSFVISLALANAGCGLIRDSWETPLTEKRCGYDAADDKISAARIFPVNRQGRCAAIQKLSLVSWIEVEGSDLTKLLGFVPKKAEGTRFYLVRGVYICGTGQRTDQDDVSQFHVWFAPCGEIYVAYSGLDPFSLRLSAKWPLVIALERPPQRVNVWVDHIPAGVLVMPTVSEGVSVPDGR